MAEIKQHILWKVWCWDGETVKPDLDGPSFWICEEIFSSWWFHPGHGSWTSVLVGYTGIYWDILRYTGIYWDILGYDIYDIYIYTGINWCSSPTWTFQPFRDSYLYNFHHLPPDVGTWGRNSDYPQIISLDYIWNLLYMYIIYIYIIHYTLYIYIHIYIYVYI